MTVLLVVLPAKEIKKATNKDTNNCLTANNTLSDDDTINTANVSTSKNISKQNIVIIMNDIYG